MKKVYIKIDKLDWLFEAYEDNNNLTLKVKDINEDFQRLCYVANFQKNILKGSFAPGSNFFFFQKELIPIIIQKINEKDYYAFTDDTKLHLIIGKEKMKHEFILESVTEMPDDNQKNKKKKRKNYGIFLKICTIIILLFSIIFLYYKK